MQLARINAMFNGLLINDSGNWKVLHYHENFWLHVSVSSLYLVELNVNSKIINVNILVLSLQKFENVILNLA